MLGEQGAKGKGLGKEEIREVEGQAWGGTRKFS